MSILSTKITQNKSKHLLVENELTTLEYKIPDVCSLVQKTDYDTKIGEIDTKVSSLDDKTDKNILDVERTIGLLFLEVSIFDGEDGLEAYFIFQPVYKNFTITTTNYISSWKLKRLSTERNKPFPTSNNSVTLLLGYYDYKIRVTFNGSILRQPEVRYTHGKVVNIYIAYELGESS